LLLVSKDDDEELAAARRLSRVAGAVEATDVEGLLRVCA